MTTKEGIHEGCEGKAVPDTDVGGGAVTLMWYCKKCGEIVPKSEVEGVGPA
jgi:hypothetical protein